WGGTRPRIHTIMLGIAAGGLFLALVGVAQTPILLGVMLFLLFFPIPMINATSMSLLQAKVAPEIQGRVFAALSQMATLLIPLSYLLVGPLADTVFEPAVGTPGWERVAPLVGSTTGAGMGLLMVIAGAALVVVTLAVYAVPRVRGMEAELPDYAPKAADDGNEALPVTLAAAGD